jgi:hypothetical protein
VTKAGSGAVADVSLPSDWPSEDLTRRLRERPTENHAEGDQLERPSHGDRAST